MNIVVPAEPPALVAGSPAFLRLAAALVAALLPGARRFTLRLRPVRQVPADIAPSFRKPGLAWLFALWFLLMGGFVPVHSGSAMPRHES